jgi:hypothetical protein
MSTKMQNRINRLLPNGFPRYVRCYDSGEGTGDRYTVVFTGRYQADRRRPAFVYLGMDAHPFHPQGIGMHGDSKTLIDRPAYSHLGKKIPFQSLPLDCQRCALNTYRSIWGLV